MGFFIQSECKLHYRATHRSGAAFKGLALDQPPPDLGHIITRGAVLQPAGWVIRDRGHIHNSIAGEIMGATEEGMNETRTAPVFSFQEPQHKTITTLCITVSLETFL